MYRTAAAERRVGIHRQHVIGISCSLLVVGCCCMSFAQVTTEQLLGRSVDNPTDQRYNEVETAVALFFSGEVEEARKTLAAVAAKSPDLPPVGVMLSQLYFATSQISAARAELERVATEYPNDPESYLMFGDLALRDGDLTVAQSLYLRGRGIATRLDQNPFRKKNLEISAEAGLATIAASRGNWPSAERHTRQWLGLDPQSAQANNVLGRALFFRQQYQSAYEAFQAAHRFDPQSPLPEVNMALLYEELVARGNTGKRDSAMKAMRMAAERDADSLRTRLAVARWALDACEIEMAEAHAQAALELDESSVDAMTLVGLVARHRGDLSAAQQMFESAHLRNPANFDVLVQLALVLVEQPQPAKQKLALDYSELNFRSNSDQSQVAGRAAAVILAWVLHRLGRRSDSVATVQAAVNAGQVDGEVAFVAARILSENGLQEQALRVLQPALATNSCFPTRQAADQLLQELRRTD